MLMMWTLWTHMDDTHDQLYKAYVEYHKANEQFAKKKSYRTKIKARKFLSLIRRLAIKRRAEIMEQFKAAQKNNNETGNN